MTANRLLLVCILILGAYTAIVATAHYAEWKAPHWFDRSPVALQWPWNSEASE